MGQHQPFSNLLRACLCTKEGLYGRFMIPSTLRLGPKWSLPCTVHSCLVRRCRSSAQVLACLLPQWLWCWVGACCNTCFTYCATPYSYSVTEHPACRAYTKLPTWPSSPSFIHCLLFRQNSPVVTFSPIHCVARLLHFALAQPETYLEDVKRDPLTDPKHDRPTKTGMIQDMTPRW